MKQNSLIRQMLNMKKYSHISITLKCLKLFTIEKLYIFHKLTFIQTLKCNQMCWDILSIINKDPISYKKESRSVMNDLYLLSKSFDTDINNILNNPRLFINKLKNDLNNNGCAIHDSIKTCLENYKNPIYMKMFKDITSIKI